MENRGRCVLCDDGNKYKASLIFDANGFASTLIEYDNPNESWVSDCLWNFS
jgi:hypothetical protein